MFKFFLGFIPSIITTFSNLKNFNEIYKNLQQQQKNVTLFHLGGHWIRLRVGGQPFVVRRKTLNKHPESILAGIAQDDKSSKKISEILLETIVGDEGGTSSYERDNLKEENRMKEQQFKKDTYYKMDQYYNDNKKLPVKDNERLRRYQQFKMNQEYQEELEKIQNNFNSVYEQLQDDSQEELKKIKEKEQERKEQERKEHDFDEEVNDKGEKKIKFEKDHDGFYLIDRDPVYFNYILNYLRTNYIQIPSSLDIQNLIADSKFYRLTELEMILNDKVINDKRNLEMQEIYKNEFSLHNILNENNNHGNKQSLYFILPMNWFVQWKRFIDGGNQPPSIINTTVFFKTIDGYPINSLRDNLTLDCDYICISKETWLSFNKFYKLIGPIIMRTTKNIYDNPPEQFISSKIWNVK